MKNRETTLQQHLHRALKRKAEALETGDEGERVQAGNEVARAEAAVVAAMRAKVRKS